MKNEEIKAMFEELKVSIDKLDTRITALEQRNQPAKQTSKKSDKPAATKSQTSKKSESSDKEWGDSYIAIYPVTETKVKFAVCDSDWNEKYTSDRARKFNWHAINGFLKSYAAIPDFTDWTWKFANKTALQKIYKDSHKVAGGSYRFQFTSAEMSGFTSGAKNSKVVTNKEIKHF